MLRGFEDTDFQNSSSFVRQILALQVYPNQLVCNFSGVMTFAPMGHTPYSAHVLLVCGHCLLIGLEHGDDILCRITPMQEAKSEIELARHLIK